MAADFFFEYFVKPIISPETQGYNIVNTAVYIILLVIACAIIYFALRKKIEFNKNFFTALLPFIIFGISMRVIMHQIEAGLLAIDWLQKTASPLEIGFWFFTPGIWILTFALVVIGLLIGGVWKKLDTRKLFWFGIIIAAAPLLFNLTCFNNWGGFLGTAALIIAVTCGTAWAINKFTKYKILDDWLNIFVIGGQAIDGIASSIAIAYYNFSEQHVVSNSVLNIHPIFFVVIKLGVAILICYTLDDYLKDKKKEISNKRAELLEKTNQIKYIKVIIAILGFATGLASLFKLGII